MKEMEIEILTDNLAAVMPDWQVRLGVPNVREYVNEAAQAGLVQVPKDSLHISSNACNHGECH